MEELWADVGCASLRVEKTCVIYLKGEIKLLNRLQATDRKGERSRLVESEIFLSLFFIIKQI